MNRRLPVRLLAPAAALVLLTGCAAGEDTDGGPDVAAAPTTAAASASTSPSAVASPTPAVKVIEVSYAGGQVTGVEARVPVALGEQVLLRVTSDVAEEIHVHGYDLYTDLPAGGTGEVAFTADIPGSFEVELHEVGRPLFQLRVA